LVALDLQHLHRVIPVVAAQANIDAENPVATRCRHAAILDGMTNHKALGSQLDKGLRKDATGIGRKLWWTVEARPHRTVRSKYEMRRLRRSSIHWLVSSLRRSIP
jgi:hypothetical protein